MNIFHDESLKRRKECRCGKGKRKAKEVEERDNGAEMEHRNRLDEGRRRRREGRERRTWEYIRRSK